MVADTVQLADSALPNSVALDTVALSDSALVESFIFYPVFASDTVAIADNISPDSSVVDTIAAFDLVSLDSTVLDVVAMSESALVESFIFYELLASDVAALADIASLFSTAVDTVDLSDSALAQLGAFNEAVATDIVAIVDAVSTFSSVIDIVQIVDTASLPTSVTDIVDIVITTTLATTKSIVDQMSIGDSFFDIAAVFNRTFSEILALPDCVFTNESGMCNRVGIAGIILGDALQLMLNSVNNPAEQLSAQDQLARNITSGRSTTESMQAGDSRAMSVVSPPPPPPPAIAAMPVITTAMTETMGEIDGLQDPKEAVEVGGTWDMDAFDNESLESILGTIGMPAYNTSMTASSAGADEMTMVLPTFVVTANVDSKPSGDGIFITPTISDVPAGMQVMIPINVRESIDRAGGLDMLGNMTVSFTPAQSASNFTMMIATLDDNPESNITQASADGIPVFYIDVSFTGSFTGGATPSDEVFFEEPPQVAFTITEDWALDNKMNMPGGVPTIKLSLLDETTGEWTRIPQDDINAPAAAVNGVFTYKATLPHLSTYVVSSIRESNIEADNKFTRSLVESMAVSSTANLGVPLGEGKVVTKEITESLAIRAIQPEVLHQRVITIDDVTVAISVVDVRPAGLFGAVATVNFEITNKGDAAEELTLRYRYADSAGRTAYEGEMRLMVDANQTAARTSEIPFYSAGSYDVMIEATSKDGTLAVTSIAIDVPWLAVNLALLIVIAVIVVAASVASVAYAMRTRFGAGRK